ncbi:glycosyltransferase family 2 protein [Microbacterium oxydans]|uniref:glycosyltransferase family 2 protein n=1 Tax=Microbacterium oxydans TaxID=82380 RepID=UPI0024AD89B0|nr:glycosyltransferase family 2 protein [Microbacterium oxydans]
MADEVLRPRRVARQRMQAARSTRQVAAGVSLIAVAACVAVVWWLNGGPSWYGAVALVLVLAKTVLHWGADDAIPASRAERTATDGLNLAVAVPCYNEDPELLKRTLRSMIDQNRRPASVTVVDDGSTDSIALVEARRWDHAFRCAGIDLTIISFPENRGKRHGLVAALDAHPEADVLLGVDSDSILQPTAIAEGIAGLADPRVMVSTGMVLPSNYDTNVLTRMQDVRYASAFLFDRAALSSVGSVLCACGTIAFYRASMMRKYRDDFVNQRFFGKPAVLGDLVARTRAWDPRTSGRRV